MARGRTAFQPSGGLTTLTESLPSFPAAAQAKPLNNEADEMFFPKRLIEGEGRKLVAEPLLKTG